MLGQGVVPASHHHLARLMSVEQLSQALAGLGSNVDAAVNALPSHQAFIESYCRETSRLGVDIRSAGTDRPAGVRDQTNVLDGERQGSRGGEDDRSLGAGEVRAGVAETAELDLQRLEGRRRD